MSDTPITRAKVVTGLATSIFGLILEAIKQHGEQPGMEQLTTLDGIVACGAATKAIGMLARDLHPDMGKDECEHDLLVAFMRGLNMPDDGVTLKRKA